MRRRALLELWPAAAAWAAAAAVNVVTAAASGFSPFHAGTWARWDSALYADIARHGYTLFDCPTDPGSWCGNAGWFPLYPWSVAALHVVGLPFWPAAVAVAWAFSAATVALVWATFLERRLTPVTAVALVYTAFAPGEIFDFAVFPLSMLAFWTVAWLWLMNRERWLAAGVAGALAALSYPVGVAIAPAAALWLLGANAPARRRLGRAALVAGLTLAGAAVVPLVQWIELDRWNAYFLVQAKYQHGWRNPLSPLHDALYTVTHESPVRVANAPAVQTVLVAATLAAVFAWLAWQRFRVPRLDLLVALWALLAWLLPHAQANVSEYRSEAVLLPLVLLLRRLPRPILVLLAAAAIWLAVPMAQLFFRNRLP